MKIAYSECFEEDYEKAPKSIQKALARTLDLLEQAETLRDIPNCKKLKGQEDWYRIRFGDYRATLTFVKREGQLFFLRLLSRGQIYKKGL